MACKLFLLLVALALTSAASSDKEAQPTLLGARLAHLRAVEVARSNPGLHFKAWAERHTKHYLDDVAEFARRLKIWVENLEYAAQYNQRVTSHWIGLNHLADLTQEEYRARLLGYDNAARVAHKAVKAPTPFRYAAVSDDQLPVSVDWRKKTAVSPVKNQMQCGSCWAFATTGAVEGVNALYTGSLEVLSEQELVDCDTEQDQGCNGGLMDFAYQFIIDNGGINTEEDYPYTALDGVCDARRLRRKVVSIDGFEDVPVNNEAALKKAVAHQPVAVAIEADQKSFQLYMGGVYDDEEGCGTVLDHGVLAAGYGRDAKAGAYWIIKNSWGAEWGEHGYIRIKMNAAAKEGMCGIAMAASYPVKKHENPPATPPTPVDPPAPPPPPAKRVVCDDSNECPADTTCCCATGLLDACVSWGCCPAPKATCCEDRAHCCPSSLPVCDVKHARCLPSPSSSPFDAAQPWLTRTPAKRTGSYLANVLSAVKKARSQEAHVAARQDGEVEGEERVFVQQ